MPHDGLSESVGFEFRGNCHELNPNWQIRATEISNRAAAQELRALRQMTQEGNEITSQMARAWTNALSDQTYIRDPDTGEIFKVHKRVWDTGNFRQEPTFKRIFGTVAEGTPLANLLKEEGWKRMQESLSGWETWAIHAYRRECFGL